MLHSVANGAFLMIYAAKELFSRREINYSNFWCFQQDIDHHGSRPSTLFEIELVAFSWGTDTHFNHKQCQSLKRKPEKRCCFRRSVAKSWKMRIFGKNGNAKILSNSSNLILTSRVTWWPKLDLPTKNLKIRKARQTGKSITRTFF